MTSAHSGVVTLAAELTVQVHPPTPIYPTYLSIGVTHLPAHLPIYLK